MEAGFKEKKTKTKTEAPRPLKSYTQKVIQCHFCQNVLVKASDESSPEFRGGGKIHLPMGGASKSRSKEQEGLEGFFWSSLGIIYHSEFYVHLFSPIDYLPKVKSLFVLILRFSQCLA